MKRVSSFLMAFCIFLLCLLSCSLSVFAVSEMVIDYSVSIVYDFFVNDVLGNYVNNLQKKVEAFRTYYFYKLCNNDYNFSGNVFSSDGKRFNDDYLNYTFDYYLNIAFDEYDSNGDIFLSAAGFSNTSWHLLGIAFISEESGNTGNENYWRSDYKNYYQVMLANYLIDQGLSGVSDISGGKTGLEIAPGYVSSDDLVEGIETENTTFSPKNENMFLNSYRTDTYFHSSTTDYAVTLFNDPNTKECLKDLWLVPFYYSEAGLYYYSLYQLHLYFTPSEDPNADFDFRCDTYKFNSDFGYIYDDSKSDILWQYTESELPFQIRIHGSIGTSSGSCSVFIYNTAVSYDNKKYDKSISLPFTAYYQNDGAFYKSDLTLACYGGYSSDAYQSLYQKFKFHNTYSSRTNKNDDVGYICSHDMISTSYAIDTSKIPSNQIIQVTGDTIYNYTMIDPDSGKSNTVTEYITNNYTYITNTTEDSGSAGGGVGGEVVVGGQIDVSGNVGVDVNVNINGGNGGGAVVNPDDILNGSSVDLNKYYDQAVEDASGVRQFFGKFFDFLPAEILSLILLLVAVAIVCRIFGR